MNIEQLKTFLSEIGIKTHREYKEWHKLECPSFLPFNLKEIKGKLSQDLNQEGDY